MKKRDAQPTPNTPLRLRKETLRTLVDEELDGVAGGYYTPPTEGIMCWMPSHPGGSGGSGPVGFIP